MHHNVASLEADSSIRKLHLTRRGGGTVTLTLQDGSTVEKELAWYECTESANSIVELYKAVTEQGEFFNAIVVSGLGYYVPGEDQPYIDTSYGSIANSHNVVITEDYADYEDYLYVKKGSKMFIATGAFFNGDVGGFGLGDTISLGPVLILNGSILITPTDAAYHPLNGTVKWEDVEVVVPKMERTIYFL